MKISVIEAIGNKRIIHTTEVPESIIKIGLESVIQFCKGFEGDPLDFLHELPKHPLHVEYIKQLKEHVGITTVQRVRYDTTNLKGEIVKLYEQACIALGTIYDREKCFGVYMLCGCKVKCSNEQWSLKACSEEHSQLDPQAVFQAWSEAQNKIQYSTVTHS